MKQQMYGQIDLTKIGNIVKNHPELVKHIQFKDGEHKLLNISILAKDEPDKYGNTSVVKASCKKDDERQGVNYFLGDLKNSTPREQVQTQSFNQHDDYTDLGF